MDSSLVQRVPRGRDRGRAENMAQVVNHLSNDHLQGCGFYSGGLVGMTGDTMSFTLSD
jgi:hypothetical protein